MTVLTEIEVQAQRLRQFICWDLLASLLGTLFVISLYLYFSFAWMIILVVVSGVNSLTLSFAWWLANRHRIDEAIFIICVPLWLLLIVVIYVVPAIFPGLALLTIWPVALGVPCLSRANLRKLMIVSVIIGFLTVLLSTRADTFKVLESVPTSLLQGAVIVCASSFTALTLLQLWQYSGRLNDTLDQMKVANKALQESERSLEEIDKIDYLNHLVRLMIVRPVALAVQA